MNGKMLKLILTVSLIIGLLCAGKYIFDEAVLHSSDNDIAAGETFYFNSNELKELSVELIAADFTVKAGNEFSVKSDSKYISYNESNGKIYINEKPHKLNKNSLSGSLILTLPQNIDISKIRFRMGSGNMKVEKLFCDEFSLDYGAGKVEFSSLSVSENTKINCGMGNLTVKSGELNNLKLDIGVGELSLKAALLGESEINGGVGKTDIVLLGGSDMYSFELDCSLGDIKIGGKSVKEGEFGTGENAVEINGGIGSISINFE